ncbi:hypothetical protein B2G71_04840 [Novosphingobium sp. PC22D]|uniref:glycoside hydrolase family 15 protein n=1 Tax=Novosphingobium sp. PC22D TaxID=1962403 RepID=UPI000BF2256E|nr:glycoside hydrolase family 15 protein [Novosphingobium sp. PC22D]PEQ13657.1 hypothetical protein B2G71_04840 [Novosphingobium sp. PC22D]
MSADRRIADYAMIGDGETAALVHRDATIEWLCFPRFDSEACFAAILGDRENGCWSVQPTGKIENVSRRYRDDSLILETDFATPCGRVRITDFMPIRGEAPDVVRIVEGLEGEVEVESDLVLRFDYGRIHPMVRKSGDGRAVAIAGPNGVSLHFDCAIEAQDRRLVSRFTVREGESRSLVLTWFASHLPEPRRVDPMCALHDTVRFWRDWSEQIDYDAAHRPTVLRSLMTLKALMHRPTGGIVAAPTSSLPEAAGGERNWDYRYCWLRDSTLMLLAFSRMGLREEARHWIDWLARAVGGDPIVLQPFFGIDGSRRLPEWEADWLAGFGGARPVRFGNDAVGQLQLDIYGEVIDALFQAVRDGVEDQGEARRLIRALAQKLEAIWCEPDAGIWESRGPNRHHTYSKAMCWVAFDRTAALLCDRDKEESEHYCRLAETVRERVLAEGFDEEADSFTAAFDDTGLDAALLRLPLVGFIDANDPRMIATVAAIERHLVRDGFVWRYNPDMFDDGIGTSEGAFVAPSFWLAEVYYMQGREDEAIAMFERIAGHASDLGLMAEEISPGDPPRQLGNFPQGLSHLALVTAARRLFGPREDGNERKAESEPLPETTG